MTLRELSSELKRMYENAPKNDKKTMIFLFAIRYAEELNTLQVSAKDLLESAKLPNTYTSEIGVGKRLSKYVVCK